EEGGAPDDGPCDKGINLNDCHTFFFFFGWCFPPSGPLPPPRLGPPPDPGGNPKDQPTKDQVKCALVQRITKGLLGVANIADATIRAVALPAGVSAVAEAPPAAGVLAVYGTTSIFGQATAGSAQIVSAITGRTGGTPGRVEQVGNILSGPAAGFTILLLTHGNFDLAERGADLESFMNGGVGLVNKAEPLFQRAAEALLGAAGMAGPSCSN